MESRVVRRNRSEFEAARIAAAFGVTAWDSSEWDNIGFLRCRVETISCAIVDTFPMLRTLRLDGTAPHYCDMWNRGGEKNWSLYLKKSTPALNELMAHGLYRLGFDEGGIRSQLPTLSMHEQLELRLTMPRDFWPKTWRDEEA